MNKHIGLLIGLVIVGLLVAGRLFLPMQWNEFTVKNITIELPKNQEWNIPPLNEADHKRLISILSQPFTYLGKGNQVFAFESKDHQYVLKFFKFAHLKPSWYTGNESREWRIQRIFSSHKLAYDLNKDNAGLIYMQLNPGGDFQHVVDVKDGWGYHLKIDLSQVIFVVQEKTTPSRVVLSELLDRGDVKTAIKRFQSLIELQLSEYSRGIYDQDHNLMHNTGFIGERPIRFDVGKMARLNVDPQLDLAKIHKRIEKWLQRYYPNYQHAILKELKRPHS